MRGEFILYLCVGSGLLIAIFEDKVGLLITEEVCVRADPGGLKPSVELTWGINTL